MGYIYKITNNLNGKVYIGQTRTTIKERIRKHCMTTERPGIDSAIAKYGFENFTVEELCQCPDEELDEREKQYIQKYDCYNTDKGYNLTPGGQEGSTWLNLDEEQVIAKYHELKNVKNTSDYFKCSEPVISRILHKHNIPIYRPPGRVENILGKGQQFKEGDGIKAVRIIELNKEFPSLKECSIWLMENGYSKASSMEATRKSLSRALNGDRATYCKLHFEFI